MIEREPLLKGELRCLLSTDTDGDLRSHDPGPHFYILVRAMIGPRSAPGEESFDLEVCSPSWLSMEARAGSAVLGRFRLFMTTFDVDVIERYILSLIDQAEGRDWLEVRAKLARWLHSEFEDYVP